MPSVCAPSTQQMAPLLCASFASSLTGVNVPVTVSQCATLITLVRPVTPRLEGLQYFVGALGRRADFRLFHHDAVALGAQQPRLAVTVVLQKAEQNFVASRQFQAPGDQGVALGRIPQDRHLVGRNAQELRRLLPDQVGASLQDGAVLVGILRHHPPVVDHRVENRFWRRPDGPVVEIPEPFLKQEFPANLGPVAFVGVPGGGQGLDVPHRLSECFFRRRQARRSRRDAADESAPGDPGTFAAHLQATPLDSSRRAFSTRSTCSKVLKKWVETRTVPPPPGM